MDKVYLKYDDNRPCVECDYGFAKGMILLGFLYPIKKGDLKNSLLLFFLELAICVLLIVLLKIDILYKVVICLGSIFFVNLIFACNYNVIMIERLLREGYYPMDYESSDKLIKKGIYFKLQ